jgi:hypothetical protein
MATVQDLIVAAYAKSGKNKGQQIATEGTELLKQFNRNLRGYFSVAARVNPLFFGKKATVAFGSGKWAYPADVEALWRVETEGGEEVALVPLEDRQAEVSLPAVYYFAQALYSAGNAEDPTSGNLVLFYSRQPTEASTVTSAIDTDWPVSFEELLVLDLAAMLATKDNRGDELENVRTEWNRWFLLFAAHVEHANMAERRRFNLVRRFNSNTIGSLSQLVGSPAAAP